MINTPEIIFPIELTYFFGGIFMAFILKIFGNTVTDIIFGILSLFLAGIFKENTQYFILFGINGLFLLGSLSKGHSKRFL